MRLFPRALAKDLLAHIVARASIALSHSATGHSEAILSQAGFEGICDLLSTTSGNVTAELFRKYGAQVGIRPMLHRGITIHNADSGFEKLSMGDQCHIGRQVLIDLTEKVSIGDRVTLAMRCMILTHFHAGESRSSLATDLAKSATVTIMNDAYIGAGAILLPGVTVGAGSVVGAGAVVSKDVADGTIVAGIPARRIR